MASCKLTGIAVLLSDTFMAS